MRFLYILVTTALLAALTADSWAQSETSTQPDNQIVQRAAADQRGTDQIPLTVKILPSQPSEEQTKKEEHEKQEKAEIDRKLAFETQRIADYTDRLALITIFVFGVAVLQAGLFIWQLGYMRQEMEHTTTAAKAARDGAAAALEANLLSREIFVASQRPWVEVEVKAVGGFVRDAESASLQLQATVKNTSGSPALNVTCKVLSFRNVETGNERAVLMGLSEDMKGDPKDYGYGMPLFSEGDEKIPKVASLVTWPNVDGATALGLCVCVDYLSSVGDRHYQTGFAYLLEENDGAPRLDFSKDIPLADFRLDVRGYRII